MSKARDLGNLARRYSFLEEIDDSDVLNDLIDDLTPQLGGNLDLNSQDITGTGNINITGSITSTSISTSGDLTFGDNDKAVFGAGSDLLIYHNGTRNIIESELPNEMWIQTDQLAIRNGAGTEYLAYFDGDGRAELYYDSSAKLATTSTGIDVTGTATMDNATFNSSAASFVTFPYNGFNYIDTTGAGAALLFRVGSTSTNALRLSSNNDISFYEDTGTTPKFVWDASGEILGIGGSPNVALPATGTLLQLQRAGSSRLNITAANVSYSAIDFGDTDDLDVGKIEYYHANNTMYFSTNAANRMVIDSSGKVGIGTSSPLSPLHITATNPTVYLETSGGGATDAAFVQKFDNDFYIWNKEASGKLFLGTNN